MSNSIQTAGLIGFGALGKLIAEFVPQKLNLLIFDPAYTKSSSLQQVSQADIVLLAVPLSAYETVLGQISEWLRPESLLVDVCSVKTKPAALIAKYVPSHTNILLSHPLFGPQTRDSPNKQLIVTKSVGSRAADVTKFCQDELGLQIVHMTNRQHDKHMARVHALTFFAARAFNELRVLDESIQTPSFRSIQRLAKLDRAHSEELFTTIQNGNPYARDEREQLLSMLSNIHQELG